jgi:L,D-transpeptidase catalytic domain
MSSRHRFRAFLILVVSLFVAAAATASAEQPASSATAPVTTGNAETTTTAPADTADPAPAEPAGAAATEAGKRDRDPGDQATSTAIRLHGLRNGKVTAGKSIKVAGTVRPFHAGQKVEIVLYRAKKTIKRKTVKVKAKGKGSALGQFKFSRRMVGPGLYRVQAILKPGGGYAGSKTSSRGFRIRYPSLSKGAGGPAVKMLNALLGNLGYVNGGGSSYNDATGRAVLAFRKVNGMSRKEKATGSIFKKLAKGKGGFKLKHPGAGKHVEADLSRQVMVLAKHGKVDEIYTISSGAPATPTIQGKFRFYRKDAGYNSLGMYYSIYFIRGYATHGYHDVPTYPASHGCLRNPIPDSVHIYNWIDLGDPIYVY